MTHNPWVPLAADRARCTLRDGATVTLVGVPRRAGHRARVEFDNGRRRTVQLSDIVAIETPEDCHNRPPASLPDGTFLEGASNG